MDQSLNKMYTPIVFPMRLKMHSDISQEQERNNIENNIETWCERLLEMNFEVPLPKLPLF